MLSWCGKAASSGSLCRVGYPTGRIMKTGAKLFSLPGCDATRLHRHRPLTGRGAGVRPGTARPVRPELAGRNAVSLYAEMFLLDKSYRLTTRRNDGASASRWLPPPISATWYAFAGNTSATCGSRRRRYARDDSLVTAAKIRQQSNGAASKSQHDQPGYRAGDRILLWLQGE